MITIKNSLNVTDKLSILSRDSSYDLACACAGAKDEHRSRSKDDKWVYPTTLPQGGTTYLFKTLLSNECVNDCKYCPLRSNLDPERCRLEPDELVKVFMDYYRKRRVEGLFLSSGVIGTADNTMGYINRVGEILRKKSFRGYIHLKIIPGASENAIRQTLSLANAVSLNIETAGEDHFSNLSKRKDYLKDIIEPIRLISRLREENSKYAHVKQTTQFVVGATDETDKNIVDYSWRLYKRLNLNRVYFSAYQRGLGESTLIGENSRYSNSDILMREHRLYQTDWLIRKYNFSQDEIPFDKEGNLSLVEDPKEAWAKRHPEYFPININRADKFKLMRIPGLGEVSVKRILNIRKSGGRVRRLEDLGSVGKRLKKVGRYISF
ncbi:MAG: helix-hairpin-helix domain-containing protein [Candidatus Kaelpia aquatica]|nr:helix-hairpin-helix domain-containing protein [Candidatus Kaelpia aquatica]